MLERDKPQTRTATRWPSPDASLVAYVEADRAKILQVYKIKPELIREHSGTEQSVLSSGYRYRQIFEVVQNAADAILEAADAGEDAGRILVRVTNSHLYVGNTGAPLSKDGIIALLGANSSRKRKSQIGRFGLGFKSLLALGGTIDLFSRSVSIRFDPEACQRTISEELRLPPEEMAPSLRMAEIVSFEGEASIRPIPLDRSGRQRCPYLYLLMYRLVRSNLPGRDAVRRPRPSTSAKTDFLLQTGVGAYATTGHWWRRYYWYCHL